MKVITDLPENFHDFLIISYWWRQFLVYCYKDAFEQVPVGIWCLKYQKLFKTLIRSRFQGMYWCAHKTATLTSIQHTVPLDKENFKWIQRGDPYKKEFYRTPRKTPWYFDHPTLTMIYSEAYLKRDMAQCVELKLRWRFCVHTSTCPEIYF